MRLGSVISSQKIRMKKITTLILGAVILSSSPVAAQTAIDAGLSGSVQVDDRLEATVTSETSVQSNSEANANGDAKSEENEVQFELNGPTVIVRSGLLDDTSISVTSSAQVDSKADLDAYAKGVLVTNADIRDVILSESQVSVSHREHARIFGIFPTKVFARATVGSDGSVSVKFPWYASAGARKAEIESKVKTAVRTHIPSASAEASVSASFTAAAQAQVLEKIAATMKSEFEADATAKAGVN
jgi:hypothetical protein